MQRYADPAEIAALVTFLCSDEASFITGAAYPIDDGYTACDRTYLKAGITSSVRSLRLR